MTRISPPAEDTFLKGAYAYSRKRYGKVLEPLHAMAHSKKLLAGYGAFETAIEGLKSMDDKLFDLAVMKAAAVVGCEWCLDFGSDISLKHGVTEEQLRDLPRYRESDVYSDDEKLVIEYAEAVSQTPVEVSDELFERLSARFEEKQIVELTAHIAIENFRARFNWALGMGSQGFTKAEVCAVPEAVASA